MLKFSNEMDLISVDHIDKIKTKTQQSLFLFWVYCIIKEDNFLFSFMKKYTFFFVLLFSFVFNFNVEAQNTGGGTGTQAGVRVPTELPLSSASVTDTIAKVVTFVLGAVGALSVLMIIVGGIMYVTGGSDRGMQETAQDIITWAVAGLIIALLGWIIINTVIGVLGDKDSGSNYDNGWDPGGTGDSWDPTDPSRFDSDNNSNDTIDWDKDKVIDESSDEIDFDDNRSTDENEEFDFDDRSSDNPANPFF